MVPAPAAAAVTRELRIPTVGIGAGPDCDAQVLVWQDMAGLRTGRAPRFVKRQPHHGFVLRHTAGFSTALFTSSASRKVGTS